MIQDIEIKKLKLLDRNPRKITKEQMTKLEESIGHDPDFLKARPVLVRDNDGVFEVYAGNQRVRAAKALKWKTIPCIVNTKEEVPDEIMQRRVVLDNVSFGEFDYDILSSEWDAHELFEMGFTTSQLDILLDSKEDLPEIDESAIKEDDENNFVTCPKCNHMFKE